MRSVLFFFQQGREIIMTRGYVKKQQKVDTRELEQVRAYKKDWEEQHTGDVAGKTSYSQA